MLPNLQTVDLQKLLQPWAVMADFSQAESSKMNLNSQRICKMQQLKPKIDPKGPSISATLLTKNRRMAIRSHDPDRKKKWCTRKLIYMLDLFMSKIESNYYEVQVIKQNIINTNLSSIFSFTNMKTMQREQGRYLSNPQGQIAWSPSLPILKKWSEQLCKHTASE